MGLAKKTTTAVAEAPVTTAVESGSQAAIDRLKTAPKTETVKAIEKVQYKQRDFDAEARGKSLCLLYGHAIGSCVVAGLQFDKREEAFAHMKFFVDAAMNEIFKDRA